MADAPHHPAHQLAVQFVAELFQRTSDAPTAEAHAAALQAFCDELFPWVTPDEQPRSPRPVFTLFEDLRIDEDEIVWVSFTPEGLALFRAWLRRRGVDPVWCSS
jgi:hypothetical protein